LEAVLSNNESTVLNRAEQSYFASDSQSARPSWPRAPLWLMIRF